MLAAETGFRRARFVSFDSSFVRTVPPWHLEQGCEFLLLTISAR